MTPFAPILRAPYLDFIAPKVRNEGVQEKCLLCGLGKKERKVDLPKAAAISLPAKPMKTLDEIREIVNNHRDVLAREYGVPAVGVFGSYVRGEQRAGSDLDLLVEILRPIDLLKLVGAEIYLSKVLAIKVDLVPKRSLRMELRETILKEAVSP